VDPWTWAFGRPGELRRDLALLNTSPERVLLAALIAPTIGLVANLWGETEFLIRAFPQAGPVVMDLKLDALYAVEGLRGYYADEYEVHYPSEWLQDQTVQLAKMGQSDPAGGRVYSSRAGSGSTGKLVPDVAFGPPGGGQRAAKERESMSVVKQPIPSARGRPLELAEVLGDPAASLQKLLAEKIAPAGSGRSAEALRAARVSRQGGAAKARNEYYEYEWRTTFERAGSQQRRTYSSAALGPPDAQGTRTLYTLTAVVPEAAAAAPAPEGVVAQMPKILERFHVLPASGG